MVWSLIKIKRMDELAWRVVHLGHYSLNCPFCRSLATLVGPFDWELYHRSVMLPLVSLKDQKEKGAELVFRDSRALLLLIHYQSSSFSSILLYTTRSNVLIQNLIDREPNVWTSGHEILKRLKSLAYHLMIVNDISVSYDKIPFEFPTFFHEKLERRFFSPRDELTVYPCDFTPSFPQKNIKY